MEGESKKLEQKRKLSTFKVIEKVHPHKMILYVSLLAGFLVLSFMLLAFSMSLPENVLTEGKIKLPASLTAGTILLMQVSYLSSKILPSYRREKHGKVRDTFGAILAFLLIFVFFQISSFINFQSGNFYQHVESAGRFAIVITGIQIVFLCIAIISTAYFLVKSIKLLHDPVRRLILTTNPYENTKLEMYVAFINGFNFLWLIIFLTFLYTFS